MTRIFSFVPLRFDSEGIKRYTAITCLGVDGTLLKALLIDGVSDIKCARRPEDKLEEGLVSQAGS